MADIMELLGKGIELAVKFCLSKKSEMIDYCVKASDEQFRNAYTNRGNKSDVMKEIIEEAAKIRNWKG